jgi:putative multiple sugar transport system substrate-binding protein
MEATSRGRRLLGVGLSLSVAVILAMTVVAPVGAATVGAAWQARIGHAGANGMATIQAYTTGSGTLALKLARLKAASNLPITLSKGTCASVGSRLITLPSIRTTRAGSAARTFGLTVAQVSKVKAATKGTGRVAIRVGSHTTGGVKCGVFAVVHVSIGIVLPTALKASGLERFQDALKAAGYSAQILYSQDAATEKTDVEVLISRGIKVLIVFPQDSAAAAAAADEARAAGVKVISYARLILGTASVDYHVDFDTVAVGAAQAQYLIDKAGASQGNNLYLYAGAASDNNSFQFLEGAWETLQPRIADGTFVIRNSGAAVGLQANHTLTHAQEASIIGQVTTNWDPNTARTVALSNLAVLPAADKGTVFILAPNDATARAIADAFAADMDVTKSYVTGQDAEKASVQSIIDGKQGMTVFKDPRASVKDAVAGGVAFLKGGTPVQTTTQNNGTIDVPSRLRTAVAVTRDNLQAALIDSGYYQASDFTGSWPGKP